MRENISVDREANAIRLRRSIFPGTFLLVEGSSDKIFYERLVDAANCELVSVSGKPSSKLRVIAVLEILEKSNFQGVLAIVDADFDRLHDLSTHSPNLCQTDTHDLETMLLHSPALDKVIAEIGSAEKVKQFEQDVRVALCEAGIVVGYLRWISQCDDLNLTFEGIKFNKFINDKTLQINEIQLIQEIKNKSQAFSLETEYLQQQLMMQKSSNHDPWQVCCGHDLVEILSLGLRKAIGTAKSADVEPERLERSLRLAYEEVYFQETQLYLELCGWERNNQPFKVLRKGH